MSAALFVLTASLLISSSQGSLERMSLPHVTVRYDPSLRTAAAEIAQEFPRLKAETENSLSSHLRAVPVIVLLRDSGEFQRHARSALVTAFAVPREELIVIDYAKMKSAPALYATIKHELVHLILAEGTHPSYPKWFDEGIAQWASGGMPDILAGESRLREAALSGRLLGLFSLSERFPQDNRGLDLAYQESKSFIEYLAKEHGDGKLRSLVAAVRAGTTFDDAFVAVFSADIYSLEQTWHDRLRKSYVWPAYLADNIYLVLFLAAAAATIAGYVRFRKRLREYRDEEDDDDLPGP